MEIPRLKIYFIHSSKIDANNILYLPVLRSEQLSHDQLIFPLSKENSGKYYKDLIDRCDVCVSLLSKDTDMGFDMELKYALAAKKPVLALANKTEGYDGKYDKMLNNIIGFTNQEEVKYFVESFAKNYEGRSYGGKIDGTVVLGVLQ